MARLCNCEQSGCKLLDRITRQRMRKSRCDSGRGPAPQLPQMLGTVPERQLFPRQMQRRLFASDPSTRHWRNKTLWNGESGNYQPLHIRKQMLVPAPRPRNFRMTVPSARARLGRLQSFYWKVARTRRSLAGSTWVLER
jgi:hypothetical protein